MLEKRQKANISYFKNLSESYGQELIDSELPLDVVIEKYLLDVKFVTFRTDYVSQWAAHLISMILPRSPLAYPEVFQELYNIIEITEHLRLVRAAALCCI